MGLTLGWLAAPAALVILLWLPQAGHVTRPGFAAGAPPDAYSADGQHWGNPLYDWPVLRRRGYSWWAQRMVRTLELFDAVRIDHFRGFVSYWVVSGRARTARNGHWSRGPGAAPFRAMRAALGFRAMPRSG